MNWQTLLAEKRIKPHTTSQQELDDLRPVIARDLTDAAIPALSADRRFATAYNAALQTAKMAAACAGYRVAGLGHHQTTFEAAELALGTPSVALIASCRRKRNTVDYDRTHVATETEAGQILEEAQKLVAPTERWIAQYYPRFRKT